MASERSGSTAAIDYTTDNSSVCTSDDTSDSLAPSEFSYSGEDRQDNELPSQDTRTPWEVGELSPGSYCRYSYYPLEREQRAGDWNPKASKGIVVQKGFVDSQWTIVSFFGDTKRFIQKMDTTANLCRERREQFILLEVLPHLEKSWGKCFESNKDIYKQLARLSHCVSSGQVVRHSLRLLLHLICRDNCDKSDGSLLDLEEIMRLSIFTPQGVFRRDKPSERTLELFAYSRILLLLLRSVVLQGELLVVDLVNDWKKVVEELGRHQKQIKNRKKDTLRYSMELICALLSNSFLTESREISPKIERMEKFLKECQEFCGNPNKESKDLKILQTLREKKKTLEWDELHFILYHLHGKVHSERPTPQMETERRAMLLLGLIIEAYLSADGGEDWRFCLAVSQLLVEIVKNNVTKELRQDAGSRLIYLLRDKKLQKKPECRAIVEKWSSQLLFSPDSEIRSIMIHFLSQNQREAITLPVERHSEHLSSIYGTQTLEINGSIISHNPNCVIVRGMFQQRKVVVKMLNVMKNHLLGEDPKFEARTRMMYEAHNLRLLSASSHANFPVLLGFDTKSMPYHIITAFECWGSLRTFLHDQRRQDVESREQAVHLLRMLNGVICALLHLGKLGLVHRCVNAENILVGDTFVCKLSGLHSLRRLTLQTIEQDLKYEGYCPIETLQYVATSTDMDLPVRWQAPESLIDCHFSTASDVYGFGMLVYEVLTYGCTPYRNILKDEEVSVRVLKHGEIVQNEDCFEDCEYMLIKQCCQWQYGHRPNFRAIQNQLADIISNQSGQSKARPDPPPLKVDICASKYPIATIEEKVYDDISDTCGSPTLSSPEESDHQQHDQYEDVLQDFVQTKNQGRTEIWEKLSQQDIQHVKELRCLKNPHLAPIYEDKLFHSFHWIVSRPNCAYGTLKDYVLRRECKKEHIVMFLSQIASACHYLHNKHIVHGNLRAACVYVESPDKVQVGRLGRSKSLPMGPYDVTSTLCVVETLMPPDASRWSSPEVNMDGYYTHASDVWAFGILAWELYKSFQEGENNPQLSIPYFGLDNNQILAHQRDGNTVGRPECCPDWVYILIHQCLAFKSEQRPPFLAIFDSLTSSKPMHSWIMKLWLETHNREKYPDLSITQGTEAFHVLPEDRRPPVESILRMCSREFFTQHEYKYVERPLNIRHDQTASKVIYDSIAPTSDLGHNENAISEEVRQEDQNAVNNALDKDTVNTKYPSSTIHYKKPTVIPNEQGYKSPIEQKPNQAELNEKDETQSYQSKKTKLQQDQEGREEVIYDSIAPNSDLGHNENTVPEEVPKQDQKEVNNALVKDSVNTEYPSFTVHYKKPTGIPKEQGYKSPIEHKRNQAELNEKDETQSYQSKKTKLKQDQEGKEEVIYDSIAPNSDLGHNENTIPEEVRQEDQNAVNNALDKDTVNTKYPSLTIHYKKPTGIPNEEGYKSPIEHRPNQAELNEKDETQSYQSKKTKLQQDQEGREEVIYDSIAPSSDLVHNENTVPEEVPKQDQKEVKKALVKDSVNIKYPSLTIHYKTPTVIPKEPGYKSHTEHKPNQADVTGKDETQSYQSKKTKLQHEQEGKEDVIYDFIAPSSDLGHNENTIPEEVRQEDQNAVNNALDKDNVNTKYPSLTIHYKKPTVIPNEQGYKSHIEHKPNQAVMTGKDETQSYQSKRTKLQQDQEGREEVIYDTIAPSSDLEHSGYEAGLTERGKTENCITISSRDSQEEQVDAKGNLEDEEEIEYSDEDGSGASGKDTPVTHIQCTDKIKEKDHAGQNLQQEGEGTECKFHHQLSRLRRRPAIRRKTKSSETKKQATRKAKVLENKENVTPEYDSQEVVHEHGPKEVNEPHRAEEQNLSDEVSTSQPQVAGREEQSSMLHTLFPDIEIDYTYDI